MITIEEVRLAIKTRVNGVLESFIKERGNGPSTWKIYDHLYGYACLYGNKEAMEYLACHGADNFSWSNINSLTTQIFNQRKSLKDVIQDGCKNNDCN